MECIVPYQMVPSKAALLLLQWIFTYFHTAPIGSVKSALEWLIGKQCTLLNTGHFLDLNLVCWVNEMEISESGFKVSNISVFFLFESHIGIGCVVITKVVLSAVHI